MIKIITSGESHGKGVSAVIEGLPAGIPVDVRYINQELQRRQRGYGRGTRMSIEKDKVEIISGVRHGKTIGSPISLWIANLDYKNWKMMMTVEQGPATARITFPRPGHADLAGAIKYGLKDMRNVLERASARETAARVAAGALLKFFLKEFGFQFYSHTVAVGDIEISEKKRTHDELEKSSLRCADPEKEKEMLKLIDMAKDRGDTIGGVSEVIGTGICIGLGSYTHYEKRLDAQIGHAMLSIPSVKGVEIGNAFENSKKFGSNIHDEIFYKAEKNFYRNTNRAGGIEGGVSNGEDIVVRCAIKPISTLNIPLRSVDMVTKKEGRAQKERADTCVVPAVGVIGESMLAFVICGAFLEKFGGDTLEDIRAHFDFYSERVKNV